KGKTPVPSSSEVALQLHRWFDRVEVKNQGSIRLGDWLVAERVLAQRGEFLKWDVEAQVPKWVEGEKTFKLATTPASRNQRKKDSILVEFAVKTEKNLPPAVLVDFQGGRQQARFEQGKAVKLVPDNSALELLIMNPDGELVVQNGLEDSSPDTPVGKERKDRYE